MADNLLSVLLGRVPLPQAPTAPVNHHPFTGLGLVEPGNIDLYRQPRVKNPDGSISTVDSVSFGDENGIETLLSQVLPDGRHVTPKIALQEYLASGKHLGKFDSVDSADNYAKRLHNEYVRGVFDKK